mmetsp:Transcript_30487/g.72597  ORF Transcript_30487/g.72597 Transcript_30487/m.72597 type:complete len:166 (+) Transcript_30487:354-851(+)
MSCWMANATEDRFLPPRGLDVVAESMVQERVDTEMEFCDVELLFQKTFGTRVCSAYNCEVNAERIRCGGTVCTCTDRGCNSTMPIIGEIRGFDIDCSRRNACVLTTGAKYHDVECEFSQCIISEDQDPETRMDESGYRLQNTFTLALARILLAIGHLLAIEMFHG